MESGAAGPSLPVWIDAQLPPALASWLRREFGVDATHIQSRGLLHARDDEVFARAREEAGTKPGLVLITKDDDFIRLIERLGPPPQILWVTAGNIGNEELRRLVLAAWPKLVEIFRSGEALAELGREG